MIGRFFAVFALFGAMLARPDAAQAQLVARVEVATTCPSLASMRAALASTIDLARVAGADTWLVRVSSTGSGSATLSLVDPAGRVSLVRTIASSDCDAMADAFALIAYTHFIELSVLPASTPPPVPREPVTPVTPAVVTTTASFTARADAQRAAAPDPRAHADLPPRAPWARASLAIAAGASLAAWPTAVSGLGAVDVQLAPTALGFGFSLRASLGTATTQQATPTDRVRLRRYALALALTRRFSLGGRARVDVALGGGVDLSRVAALDVEGAAGILRAHPTVDLGVALGVGLLGPVWAAVELRAEVLPFGDHYRIDPVGTVGLSSFFVADAGLLLGVDANL